MISSSSSSAICVTVALRQLEIARTLELGGEHGADLATQALAEVFTDRRRWRRPPSENAVWRSAVDDLQEELAHGGVDGVADEVRVEGLKHGLAR